MGMNDDIDIDALLNDINDVLGTVDTKINNNVSSQDDNENNNKNTHTVNSQRSQFPGTNVNNNSSGVDESSEERRQRGAAQMNDIDQVLANLDSIVDDELPRTAISMSLPQVKRKTRCFPLYLSGESQALPKECPRLRCTNCDHVVLRIPEHSWHNDCEYLFFRTNVPNMKKLTTKLHRSPHTTAYACQCLWTSIQGVVEVSDVYRQEFQPRQNFERINRQWVCSGHP